MADMETCDGCGIGFLQGTYARDLPGPDLCPRCRDQATTYRWRGRGPSLQQIPHRTPEVARIREAMETINGGTK